MGNNLIYSFDKQKTFRAGYMIRDSKASQNYERHDEKNMV